MWFPLPALSSVLIPQKRWYSGDVVKRWSPITSQLHLTIIYAHRWTLLRLLPAKIRQSTAGAPRPVIGQMVDKSFRCFRSSHRWWGNQTLRISPSKHCSLDPARTWLLKRTTVFIAPLICSMCKASLQSGILSVTQKQAIVYPRLKKPTLAVGRWWPMLFQANF